MELPARKSSACLPVTLCRFLTQRTRTALQKQLDGEHNHEPLAVTYFRSTYCPQHQHCRSTQHCHNNADNKQPNKAPESITLAATGSVQPGRCGNRGHLKQHCFRSKNTDWQ